MSKLLKSNGSVAEALTELENIEHEAQKLRRQVKDKTFRLKERLIEEGWHECLNINRRRLYRVCQDD